MNLSSHVTPTPSTPVRNSSRYPVVDPRRLAELSRRLNGFVTSQDEGVIRAELMVSIKLLSLEHHRCTGCDRTEAISRAARELETLSSSMQEG